MHLLRIKSPQSRQSINHLENEALQLQLLENILSKNLSVRKVERLVRELNEGGTRKLKRLLLMKKVKALFYTPNLRDIEDKLRVTLVRKLNVFKEEMVAGK